MRRSDRKIEDLTRIDEVISRCGICNLAINGKDGYPYIVPLSFGYELTQTGLTLYFHSAKEGLKMDLLNRDSKVAFSLCHDLGVHFVSPGCAATQYYESVLGQGSITPVTEEGEKEKALQHLMRHYDPSGGKESYDFDPLVMGRTLVYKLEAQSYSAKRNPPKPSQTGEDSAQI